jgi:hypothetical protein
VAFLGVRRNAGHLQDGSDARETDTESGSERSIRVAGPGLALQQLSDRLCVKSEVTYKGHFLVTMALLHLSLLLLEASSVLASPARFARQETVYLTRTVTVPAPTATAWDAGAIHEYHIHSSCNTTERVQLRRGLQEAVTLAQHAKDHILRWGNTSEIYQKYFGNTTTGEPIGWFDRVVNADKAGILFRCDNPDGNCEQEGQLFPSNPLANSDDLGWAGHWRGDNATSETVICPLSYERRKPLEAMCGLGYNVANSAINFYWASDLLHRLYHIPKVGEGAVEHYAGEYDECLELARTHPEEAVRNSDSLQYFALEAYAFDVAVPGEGCAGKWTHSSSAAAASQTSVPSPTIMETPSDTSAAAKVSPHICMPQLLCSISTGMPHSRRWCRSLLLSRLRP